jgi:hypothetical protein
VSPYKLVWPGCLEGRLGPDCISYVLIQHILQNATFLFGGFNSFLNP